MAQSDQDGDSRLNQHPHSSSENPTPDTLSETLCQMAEGQGNSVTLGLPFDPSDQGFFWMQFVPLSPDLPHFSRMIGPPTSLAGSVFLMLFFDCNEGGLRWE